MTLSFGKYKGQHISEIPLSYIVWAKDNIDKPELNREFVREYERRTKFKYDPVIFGKDQTEKIVNITFSNNILYKYFKNGECLKENYQPFGLSNFNDKNAQKLKGDHFYKYITRFNLDKYKEVEKFRPKGSWFPRGIEEGYMLLTGTTTYKGMTIEEVSMLSFDIEATSLNPEDKNAEVILISNTFRDRKGSITKKLFDVKKYNNDIEMIQEWSDWVREVDPDILLGHNVLSYDLPYLNTRTKLKLGRNEDYIQFNDSPSRFRKDGSQQYTYYNAFINGRTIIDTLFLSIKYDIGRNFPSYGLKRIEKYLGLVDDNRIEWDFKNYKTSNYKNWPENKWQEFIKYCEDDGDSPLKMVDIMLPSFFYLAQSLPKTLQQIINEASGSQLDSLMIRSYLQDGFSQPLSSKKMPFEGAISMGVPGVYDNVRKVDVASLYPSIMLQYEIYDDKKDPNKHMLYMLNYFREERLKNKKLAADTKEKFYDDLQGAQKILINSMYGFLAAGYLLYNYPKGAAEVTKHGREILQKGVEWSTGHRLKKVVKSIRNKGKENEETSYEWIVGDKISEGRGYKLVNVDTDSFSVTNGVKPTDVEFDKEINELNSIYPELIKWEADGVFDKVIVVKAKNYVLQTGSKIKYKGSSLTDQKKEPALTEFLVKLIDSLLENKNDFETIYKNYCLEALNPTDINRWCVKKTVTKSVLNPERLNEQKVYDACQEAVDKGIIGSIQEGDKVWLYQAIDGEKQKITKGELVFLKNGEPKMIENNILRFPELYKNDTDSWHYVKRVYNTMQILSNILDSSKFPKYHLKSKRKLLTNA